MPVQVHCSNPKCRRPLSVSDELVGQGARCPYCGTAFAVASSAAGSRAEPLLVPAAAAKRPRRGDDLPAAIGLYAVSEKLGEGAFGVVYKGFDAALARDVAIKVLRPEALGSEKHVERFLREAKVVGQMLHGNIVPVHQLGEHEGVYFIVSAFISGQTLADAIPDSGMEPRRAVALAIQLLEALAYAHERGVLHRDIKPANIMLNEKDTLFLMDFGLAGLVGQLEGRMTRDGTVMGTVSYMPPEQALGKIQQVGPASDLYSAGVVLYELLTGHRPFEGGPEVAMIYHVINTPAPAPSTLRSDIDPALEAHCLRALAKAAADRFPSCAAFAGALRDWLAASTPVSASSKQGSDAPSRQRDSAALVQTQSPLGKQSTIQVVPSVRTNSTTAQPPGGQDLSRRNWLLIALVALTIPLSGVVYAIIKMIPTGGGTTVPSKRNARDSLKSRMQ
jgi:serine/threonine protein kinase